jgi:hypothetical protein
LPKVRFGFQSSHRVTQITLSALSGLSKRASGNGHEQV